MLAVLTAFPPLNCSCYPAVPEKYIVPRENPWIPSEKAIIYMKKLAVECRDVYFEKMLETYRKRPTKFRAKKIAAMLHKTKHAAVVDRLTQKLQDATKEYKRRSPGEALEKGCREVLARVERRQEELKKQGIRADILREEPFTIARDSLDYKLYLMIWKERRGNRITEIEEYIC